MGSEFDTKLKTWTDLDNRRKNDPMSGRRADEALMALVDHINANKASLTADQVSQAVAEIKKRNLLPYWNYCREHLTSIGIEL